MTRLREIGYADAMIIGDVVSSKNMQAGGGVMIECRGLERASEPASCEDLGGSELDPLLSK